MSRKAKVVLIGPTGTGKTSIIGRFVENEFIEARFLTPTGVQGKESVVQGLDLVIWDTSGSEDWAAMNATIYHGSDIVIYVASYDSRESLQELNTTWVPRLNEHLDLGKVVKILAVNKSDLIGSEDALITEADVRAASEQLGTEFTSVSAKEGKGITELFSRVASLFNAKPQEPKQSPDPVPIPDPVPVPRQEEGSGCC
jgi:Ras-related protein Rab-5C